MLKNTKEADRLVPFGRVISSSHLLSILCAPRIPAPSFMAIHPVFVEIFRSGRLAAVNHQTSHPMTKRAHSSENNYSKCNKLGSSLLILFSDALLSFLTNIFDFSPVEIFFWRHFRISVTPSVFCYLRISKCFSS